MTKLAALTTCVLIACGGGAKPATTTTTPSPTDTAQAGSAAAPAPAPKAELYDRLGGQKAVVAVVEDFVDRVAADPRINLRFSNTNIPRLKSLLVEFVCMATGGPCKYSGVDMETSHAGMDLVADEFTALVEDLATTLDKFKVPAKEKGELLGALGPLQPLIVAPADRLHPVDDAKLAKANAVLGKLTDQAAQDMMKAAILAAKRGQRNYADQLFSRVEILAGVQAVAAAAPAFRDGAPPRIETAIKQMPKDAAPQPELVGYSEVDDPSATQLPGSLKGTITVDGKPLDGVGLVMLYPRRKVREAHAEAARDRAAQQDVLSAPARDPAGLDRRVPQLRRPLSQRVLDVGDQAVRPRPVKDGQSRDMKFDKLGLVRLGCNVPREDGGVHLRDRRARVRPCRGRAGVQLP